MAPAATLVSNGFVYKLVGPVTPAVAAIITACDRMKKWSLNVASLGFNVHDMCLKTVRTAFGVGASSHYSTAYGAWLFLGGAKGKYTHTVTSPPANVPIFFKGSGPDGHIAVSAGNGMCWSTDWDSKNPDNGHIGLVSIKSIETRWAMKYLGWSEYLNTTRVWSK